MSPLEWTGMAGGPVLITLVRTITTIYFDYRIERLSKRLKDLQDARAKTIQKLKDATKYDSTQELLEKYGGSDIRSKKSKKKVEEDDGEPKERRQPSHGQQGHHVARTGLPPPPTANIQRRSVTPTIVFPHPPPQRHESPSPRPPSSMAGDSVAEFAPNAFDRNTPPPNFMQMAPPRLAPQSEPHWYDRILDTLLGEDETAAKNRIVLICSKCRLVNGQAPPGTKSLSDLGKWKCMSCGALNGELDEGKRIMQEMLSKRNSIKRQDIPAETTDDEMGRSSSDIVDMDKDDSPEPEKWLAASVQGSGKRKGKRSN